MALPDDWEGTFQNNALTAVRMLCPYCENASTFAVLYNLGVGDGAQLRNPCGVAVQLSAVPQDCLCADQ